MRTECRTGTAGEADAVRDERHRLGVIGGLAALSLDAMASVAYGGSSYGVAKKYLGRRASLVAGASLVIDYVLNVAVSVAAGVAALTPAVPALFGCGHPDDDSGRSARRRTRGHHHERGAGRSDSHHRRSPSAEGVRQRLRGSDRGRGDRERRTQLADAALGHCFGYYVVQFATVILLALAANTSYGGLPVLVQLLAKDHFVPHVFNLRGQRQVYRYGIWFLTLVSAVLLIAARGDMNMLVPLFAIGVFVGFTLSQGGTTGGSASGSSCSTGGGGRCH